MRFTDYAAGSFLFTAGTVGYAYATRVQFYPAVIFLVTSKPALMILFNQAFVFTVLLGQITNKIFLGRLREAEREICYENLRYTFTEMCLALSTFRDEMSLNVVVKFTALLFGKVFHWLCEARVEHLEQSQDNSRLAHVRTVSLMAILLFVDVCCAADSLYTVQAYGASVQVFFGFEYALLAVKVVEVFVKYCLAAVDTHVIQGQWYNKSLYELYLKLVIDVALLFVSIVFFAIIFTYYGVPLHLMRQLYIAIKNVHERLSHFWRFRKITANLHERFPNATEEDLEATDRVCIICREEMIAGTGVGAPKKLVPCGHIFHFYCLRNWLERQLKCPTCRGDISSTRALSSAPPMADGQVGGQDNNNAAEVNLDGNVADGNGLNGFGAGRNENAGVQGAGAAALDQRPLQNQDGTQRGEIANRGNQPGQANENVGHHAPRPWPDPRGSAADATMAGVAGPGGENVAAPRAPGQPANMSHNATHSSEATRQPSESTESERSGGVAAAHEPQGHVRLPPSPPQPTPAPAPAPRSFAPPAAPGLAGGHPGMGFPMGLAGAASAGDGQLPQSFGELPSVSQYLQSQIEILQLQLQVYQAQVAAANATREAALQAMRARDREQGRQPSSSSFRGPSVSDVSRAAGSSGGGGGAAAFSDLAPQVEFDSSSRADSQRAPAARSRAETEQLAQPAPAPAPAPAPLPLQVSAESEVGAVDGDSLSSEPSPLSDVHGAKEEAVSPLAEQSSAPAGAADESAATSTPGESEEGSTATSALRQRLAAAAIARSKAAKAEEQNAM